MWLCFEQIELDVESMCDALTKQATRALGEADRPRQQAESELVRTNAALERIEGDYIAGRISAASGEHLQARLHGEIAAARTEADQHARKCEAVAASMAGLDVEAAAAKELAAIRRMITGEVQAGRQGNLEQARSVLRRLFVGFALVSARAPFGSGALKGQRWAEKDDLAEDPLGVEGGYSLNRVIRPEAVDWPATLDVTHRAADGFPAVQRAALALSDNLCARLAA